METDQQLLAGIARRDPEAFRLLMERYAPRVIHLGLRLMGNQADAEEVAQEVFLRLYRHPPASLTGSTLFSWLYRVAANCAADLFRKRPHRVQMLSLEASFDEEEGESFTLLKTLADPGALSPQQEIMIAERSAITRRMVGLLPLELKAPLVLSVFEQLSHPEIARILRISPKAVERRIHRAREFLKKRLGPYLQ